MFMDESIPYLAGIALTILVVGIALKRMRQPHVVGYIVAGIILGPFGLQFITDQQAIGRVGAIGVLFLMFFVGMELPLKSLLTQWRVPIAGTILQILASIGCVWLLGWWLDWPIRRIVFFGFVISMSSTAVLFNILRETGEINKPVGQDVAGITITQDLAVVPMLIVLGMMGGPALQPLDIGLQIIGGLAVIGLLISVVLRKQITLPFAKLIQKDREMQVFAALTVCFGMAFLTGMMRLSAAFGAFVAGVVVAASRQTDWARQSIDPFRVVFIGLFFISIGMLIDLRFLVENWLAIGLLVLAIFVINTLINAAVLRSLGLSWRQGLYAGALLAQIGEFSFLLAAVALEASIITDYGYQTTIALISLTLLLSPLWIRLFRRFANP